MTESTQRRLAAIISADVVGYSRLMGADEAGTLATMHAHRDELWDPLIAKFGGRVSGTAGDGFIIEFASAVAALECAIAIQLGMATRNAGLAVDRAMVLRIGINIGEVIVEDDDIFGEGVNVAARLQELAEPAGIAISALVHAQVHDKIDAAFADDGAHRVKNIAEPIHVWRWAKSRQAAAAAAGSPPPLPDKPTIAVLPFENMSGDPEQEYFADGITEDIITELSRFSELFVIARNSVFTYKGRAAKAQDVGRDLGVRYIVEGSVRKSGERVRVTAQLIDAESGNHLWAERYDRKLVDIFDLQDDLTQAIVAVLPGRLRAAEEERARRQPPADMAAFDYLLAGKRHHHRVTKEDNAEALRLLGKAIELDPQYAQAYAWRACTLGQSLQFGFCEDFHYTENEAIAALEKALSLDENDFECHRLLCEISMEQHDLDKAVVHGERALASNPNDPRLVAQRGEVLTWLGQPEDGAEWIARALRLDPLAINSRVHLLGRALYTCRRYGEAIEAYKQKTAPLYGHLAELAACYAQSGMEGEAKSQAEGVLRLRPDFSIADYLNFLSFTQAADREHLIEGLRKAGLPE